jgi:hypothetical protein
MYNGEYIVNNVEDKDDYQRKVLYLSPKVFAIM